MINCKKCGAPVPDGAPVCPNCRTQDYAPQPQKNNRKKLLIILFCLIGVLVALGVVIAVLLINRGKSDVNAFDFTCSQYTAEMNRILGENKLDENKWVVNEANAVYTGPGYQIDLKTDKDSEKVTEIGISPAGEEYAAKMAAASIMVAEPGTDQKTALSELAELSEKKQDEIISAETVVKIDEEKEQYVITPRPKDKPATKPTAAETTVATTAPVTTLAPTTAAPTTEPPTTEPPTTVPPTTEPPAPEPREYTAVELLDKSLDEIIEIMGGDFECERGFISADFGTDGTTIWISNDDILPGIAIIPRLTGIGINTDLSTVKETIKSGGLDYSGIVVTGSGKYNDSISADMTYSDLAEQFGDFEMHGVAQETLVYTANVDDYNVTFIISTYENRELGARINKGIMSSADLKEFNPTLHDIAVRH